MASVHPPCCLLRSRMPRHARRRVIPPAIWSLRRFLILAHRRLYVAVHLALTTSLVLPESGQDLIRGHLLLLLRVPRRCRRGRRRVLAALG